MSISQKEVITSIENEPIIFDEKLGNFRLIGHTVTFLERDGVLVSQISFMGKGIYNLTLGVIPDELKRSDFGSAHIFDVISKGIFALSKNPEKWGSDQKPSFGLFDKI